MRTRRSLTWALLALLSALPLSAVSSAHALDVSTARVTLRDDHIEVIFEVDLLALLSAVNPRYKDATALAVADEAAFSQLVQKTRDLLQNGSHLTVNGAHLPLVVTAFPSAGQVRFMAASNSANPQAHPELVALRLETLKPASGARTITLTLPKEAGSVLFTFIQPATRLAGAGERVAFPVLGPQPAATTK